MITLYGASGHAKVVMDVIKSNDGVITQILDDNESLDSLLEYPVNKPEKKHYENVLIAIGDNTVRKNIAANLKATYCIPMIHKSVVLDTTATIDKGTVVMANAVVNSSVKIGSHCIINTAAIIEHDVVIGNFVHVSPGAVVTGGVKIGEGSQIGASAVILPNLKIGKNVVVGAGTVVVKDIADQTIVIGNPARILKKNKTNE